MPLITLETPDQYELRTMSQAFGGCATKGGILYQPRPRLIRDEDYYRREAEYQAEEKRKAALSAEIDDLCYQIRKNPELDAELSPRIMELENQLNNFHLLPKSITNGN